MTTRRLRELALALALVAVVVIAALPWLSVLDDLPSTTDGALWLTRSDPAHPGWLRWDLLGPHFIGYRPLTALSFSVGHLAGAPVVFRLTDLALHLAIGPSVYAVYRVLAPGRPRWGGVLAGALFLGHPAAEVAVPFLARRSYLLATLLSTWAVYAAIRACRDGRPWSGWSLGTGALLALALLSNETSFALVVVLPILALGLSPSPRWPTRLAPLAASGLILVAAVALRLLATGEVGGYGSMGPDPDSVGRILKGAGGYLLFPLSAADAPTLVLGGVVGTAAVLAWLVAFGLVAPWWSPRTSDRRAPLPLLAWMLAYLLLYTLTGSWYFRQLYPVAVPLALLAAVIAAGGVQDLRSPRTGSITRIGVAIELARLLPFPILAVALLYHSPVLRGRDPLRVRASETHQARVHALIADLEPLRGPGSVHLVVPVGPAFRHRNRRRPNLAYLGKRTSLCAEMFVDEPDLEIGNAVYLVHDGAETPVVEYVVQGGRPAVVVPRGPQLRWPRPRPAIEVATRADGARVLFLDGLAREDASTWVYLFSETDGELHPVEELPP